MYENNNNYPPPASTADEETNFNEILLSVFQTRSSRMLFIRKVLGTVGSQLLICTVFTILCLIVEPLKVFFESEIGGWIGLICLVLWLLLFIPIACCNVGYGKPNPVNLTLLVIMTGLLCVACGSNVVNHDTGAILIAAATTLGVVFILTILSFLPQVDITGKVWYLLGAMIALMLFSLIASILHFTGVIEASGNMYYIITMVIACLTAVLFAVMILYQLQLIVGGGRYRYGEEDWLVASLSLFYNIVMFFLQILNITSALQR